MIMQRLLVLLLQLHCVLAFHAVAPVRPAAAVARRSVGLELAAAENKLEIVDDSTFRDVSQHPLLPLRSLSHTRV